MPIYQKRIHPIRSEIIAKEIVEHSKRIDKKIDESFSTQTQIHGLHFAWNVKFLLARSFAQAKPIPKFFVTRYDFYTLFLSELGIIRALRYMGKYDFSADEIFLIKKLQIQRGETAKLGQELPGCFISYGQFEPLKGINYNLILLEYLFLHLMKPLVTIGKIKNQNFNGILPTPFSTISIISEGERVFLVPCTSIWIIDYNQAKESWGDILGERISYLETKGYTIGCRYKEDTQEIKCYVIGPFRVVIPKIEQVDEQLYEEYYKDKKPIITNLAGIIVFGNTPVLSNVDESKGFFLVFCEVPFSLTASAFAHIGEPLSIIDKGGKYKLEGVKIKIKKELFDKFKNKVFRTVYYAKKTFNAREQILDLEKITENWILNEWFEMEGNEIYLYAPALVSLSITHKIKFQELLQILKKFTENTESNLLMEILKNRHKHEIWLKILRREKFLQIWYNTLKTYLAFKKKYKLLSLL